MKRIFLIAVACILFISGCIHAVKEHQPTYYNENTNTVFQTEFNEEEYVWEKFIFSTNKVDSINK